MTALTILGAEIRTYHQRALEAAGLAIAHAFKAGELLIEAKGQVQHGEWLPFLEGIGMKPRNAQNYMRLARHHDQLKNAEPAHLTIEAALEYLAEPKEPEDQEPAQTEPAEPTLDALFQHEDEVNQAYLNYRRMREKKLAVARRLTDWKDAEGNPADGAEINIVFSPNCACTKVGFLYRDGFTEEEWLATGRNLAAMALGVGLPV